jgi:4-azaleucine resistance transporter AzlC
MKTPDDSYLDGAREIAPLALGVAIYGLAYGLMANQAGFSPLEISAMGAIVFAGGSQIVATQQWLAGAGALAALIAGLAVNLRLMLITASIRDVYAGRPFWQVALAAHFSTDENWALLLSGRAEGRSPGFRYLIGGGVVLMSVWVAATTAGALASQAIPDPKGLGMDFAFTAAFIAIALSLFRGRADIAPWAVSLAAVVVSVKTGWLATPWALVLGGLLGAAAAGLFGDD